MVFHVYVLILCIVEYFIRSVLIEWSKVYLHLFGISRYASMIPSKMYSMIVCYNDAIRSIFGLGLKLRKEPFKVEAKDPRIKEIKELKTDREG